MTIARLVPGITSITLRRLRPEDVLRFCQQARLEAIEWGADGHVPHGDLSTAESVARMTAEAGLAIVGYGSYYRLGGDDRSNPPFDGVVETALALGAPTIRVWAGTRPSTDVLPSYWNGVVAEAQRLAEQAALAGLTISLEHQANTLNDCASSGKRLLEEIGHASVYTYWQPDFLSEPDARLDALETLLPWLTNVHAFFWFEGKRSSLEKGRMEWKKYLKVLHAHDRDHPVLLELVENDAPENLIRDSEELRKLVSSLT